MTRDLPPFPGVRAFESAARHLSFKAAAEELGVTQSAVSHQIKALEQYLEVPLFERTGRGVVLTDAGEAYLPELVAALDAIARATALAKDPGDANLLKVSVTSAFALRWLTPRLKRFADKYPDIDLQLSIDPPDLDFSSADKDVAVRFGSGDWPGLYSERLMRAMLFPACSPILLSGTHPLREPSDLKHHTLLHYDDGEDWLRWLRAADARDVDHLRGNRCNDCNLMIETAIEGLGVALLFENLIADELKSGRLVKPFKAELLPDAWYHVICPENWLAKPKIAAFRTWLLDEAANASDAVGTEKVARPSLAIAG